VSTATLSAPQRAATRDYVREWLDAELPPGVLRETVVSVDCSSLRSVSPSFVDELIKVVLLEREALTLRLVNPDERAQRRASLAADNRNLRDRLEMEGESPSPRRPLSRLLHR